MPWQIEKVTSNEQTASERHHGVPHTQFTPGQAGWRSVERRRAFAATCSRNLSITSLVVAPHTSLMLLSNTATIFSFTRRLASFSASTPPRASVATRRPITALDSRASNETVTHGPNI